MIPLLVLLLNSVTYSGTDVVGEPGIPAGPGRPGGPGGPRIDSPGIPYENNVIFVYIDS